MYLSIRGYKNHKYQRSTDGIPILRGLKRGFFARETWRRTRLQGLGAVHLVDLCPACRRSGRASWGSQMLNLLFGWDILGNYIILIYIYIYIYVLDVYVYIHMYMLDISYHGYIYIYILMWICIYYCIYIGSSKTIIFNFRKIMRGVAWTTWGGNLWPMNWKTVEVLKCKSQLL